ncbi:ArgS-related anticodon-binding protein NrtL [Streptomyces sp. NPDC018610]|uniref:ArgS-related anticodon-binding protein NrtL n=1 Tax=Streptomyces sp. NPDC018610 TaxID=3365049 RepID=UPI0037A387A5
MTPVELSRTVLHAVRRAVDVGELSVALPERVVVTPPGAGGCGDYATNVALQLARPAGQPALRVADLLRAHLIGLDGIRDVAVTGPGFLNISLREADADAGAQRLVEDILRRGERYGHGGSGVSHGVQHLRCPREPRALVHADVVARLLRAVRPATVVRISCVGSPPPQWEEFLEGPAGVGSGEAGGLHVPGGSLGDLPGDVVDPVDSVAPVDIRPVPVPASAEGDLLALGRDAARWALLHPAPHDRPRIGREHLVQRESNPLFRVRYAHARTRALLRNAADLGFGPEPGPTDGPAARALLAVLADHPRVLGRAAEHRAPDRLARHLVDVADAALPYLATVLPLGEEKPSAAHRARLALAEAAGTVLAGGLSLLGVDAPDHL